MTELSVRATKPHTHRWRIGERRDDGAFPATCRHCDTKRTFPTEPKKAHGRNYWGRRPVE